MRCGAIWRCGGRPKPKKEFTNIQSEFTSENAADVFITYHGVEYQTSISVENDIEEMQIVVGEVSRDPDTPGTEEDGNIIRGKIEDGMQKYACLLASQCFAIQGGYSGREEGEALGLNARLDNVLNGTDLSYTRIIPTSENSWLIWAGVDGTPTETSGMHIFIETDAETGNSMIVIDEEGWQGDPQLLEYYKMMFAEANVDGYGPQGLQNSVSYCRSQEWDEMTDRYIATDGLPTSYTEPSTPGELPDEFKHALKFRRVLGGDIEF